MGLDNALALRACLPAHKARARYRGLFTKLLSVDIRGKKDDLGWCARREGVEVFIDGGVVIEGTARAG